METTLPRPWEEERSFHDALRDWMGRAPWMSISAAAHLLLYLVLSAIPWRELRTTDERRIVASFEAPPPPEPVDDRKEEVPIDPVADTWEEPKWVDATLDDVTDFEPAHDAVPEARFEPADVAMFAGLGGGGPAHPGRFGERKRSAAGRGTEQALREALDWLAAHQGPDGSWDADGFATECGEIGAGECGGKGQATHDVGVTGLALLALMGDGHTTDRGRYRDTVRSGVAWLYRQQDRHTGSIGEEVSHDHVYDHAIATLAVCEAYYFGRSPLAKEAAQGAVDYIHRARNPYGAWRYDVPPIGDNDTSVTGWMMFALAAARDAGLRVDEAALQAGLDWIDEVTDGSGRVGYDRLEGLSSRTPANEAWPRDKGEAMTAVGLLCRLFVGRDLERTRRDGRPILQLQADLLARKPPVWDESGKGCDMYYWYYGTYAMFQIGGDPWRKWNAAMKSAVVEHQRRQGDAKGSWDPVGPWGYSGGRVYSTALMTLCLEVYFRYARVFGAR